MSDYDDHFKDDYLQVTVVSETSSQITVRLEGGRQ